MIFVILKDEKVYMITIKDLSIAARKLILHDFSYLFAPRQWSELFRVLTEIVSKVLNNDNGKIKGWSS